MLPTSSLLKLQIYLDLKDHPERSAEAAEQLRRVLLSRETL